MDNVALIFLADDRDAQRLAVAWPKLGEARCRRALDGATLEKWAALTGVHPYAVRRIGPVLLEHGICKRDGTTDENALAFIRRLLAKSVRRPATRK